MILDRKGATNACRGVKDDVHPLDERGVHLFGFRHSLAAAQRGAERTEVAEAHALPLLEAVDDFHLEGIDHGLHVGRSERTFLLDALNDFVVVVHHGRNELGIVKQGAGLDVFAANNVVG